MMRVFKSLFLLLCAVGWFTSSVYPVTTRFADLDGNRMVDYRDLFIWHTQYFQEAEVPVGERGNLIGAVSAIDHLENPVDLPPNLWVFLEGAQGTFCAAIQNNSYYLSGVPIGSYTVIAGDHAGFFREPPASSVVIVADSTQELDLVLTLFSSLETPTASPTPDPTTPTPNPHCGEDCPVGVWDLVMQSSDEEGTGTGEITFFVDHTIEGHVTFVVLQLRLRFEFEGTYSLEHDCTLTFEGIAKDKSGFCHYSNEGIFGSTQGMVFNLCGNLEGLWYMEIECFGSPPEVPPIRMDGTYMMTSRTPRFYSQHLTVPSLSKDLDDDGKIGMNDLLLILDQWHVIKPTR